MFIKKYVVFWHYSENGHVFKSKFYDSYEEAKDFVKSHTIPFPFYEIEELLFVEA